MYIENIFSLVGIGLTIPVMIAEADEYTVNNFATWIKIAPQFMLFFAIVTRLFNKTQMLCGILSIISLVGSYFLLLFNSQRSSYVICKQFDTLCPENDNITCDDSILEVWEGILYLLGLCFKIIGSTLLIRNSFAKSKSLKVVPDPKS